MIDSQQVDAGGGMRALNDAEIADVSGAMKCVVGKPILNIGWLRMDWVNCGGSQGIAVSSGDDVTIVQPG